MGSEIYFNDTNMDYMELNILGHEFIHDFSVGIVDRLEKLNTRIKKLNKTIKSSFQQFVQFKSTAGGGKKVPINLRSLFTIDDNIIHICNDIINILINEHVYSIDNTITPNTKTIVNLTKIELDLLNKILEDIHTLRNKIIETISSFDTNDEIKLDESIAELQKEFDIIVVPLDDSSDKYIFTQLITSDNITIQIPNAQIQYDPSFNENTEYEKVFIGNTPRNKLSVRALTRIKKQVVGFINILNESGYGPTNNYHSDGINDFIRGEFLNIDKGKQSLFTYISADTLIAKRNQFMNIYNKSRIQKLIIQFNLLHSIKKNDNYQLADITDDLRIHNTVHIENIQFLASNNDADADADADADDISESQMIYNNVGSHLMDTLVMGDSAFFSVLCNDSVNKYDNISHASMLFLNYYYDAFVEQDETKWDNRLSHCAILDSCIMEHKMKLFGFITDDTSMSGGLHKLNSNAFKNMEMYDDLSLQKQKSKVTKNSESILTPDDLEMVETKDNSSHHENILYAFYACIQTNPSEVVRNLYTLYSRLYMVYYDLMKDITHPIEILNSDKIIFMLKLGFINEFKQNDYIVELAYLLPIYKNINQPDRITKIKGQKGGDRRILTRKRNISLHELRNINRNDRNELTKLSKIIEEKKMLRKKIKEELVQEQLAQAPTPEQEQNSDIERNTMDVDVMKKELEKEFGIVFEEKDNEIFNLMFDSNQYAYILNMKEELAKQREYIYRTPEYLLSQSDSESDLREKYMLIKNGILETHTLYTQSHSLTNVVDIVDRLLLLDEDIDYIISKLDIPYLRPIRDYIGKKTITTEQVIRSENDIVVFKMTMMANLNELFVLLNRRISKIDMFGNVCKVKINDIDNELETFSKHVTNNSMFELFTSIKASKEKVLDLHDRQTINHVAQMIARIAMKYALGRDGHKSMKMTKDDLIQYIKDETADSPMNRFNNDFLKLQMNILSVWGLYTKINLLGEFDEKSETIFPEFTLDNVDTFKHSNYDNNILSGFSSIIKRNEEFEAKRVYNELLQSVVEHPSLVNSKFVINNSSDLVNAQLLQSSESDEDAHNINYLKSKYFCPLSSVIDAQVSCNLNMALNRDGAEFGSFHITLANSNKTRHYEVLSNYHDELYNNKKDAQYLYSSTEITLKKDDIYIPISFNTYLYNFKNSEEEDSNYEKMINSMKGAELSARNVYKLLIYKITNLVTQKYDKNEFTMHDIWNELELNDYESILQISTIKSAGDIFQELNTVTKHGGYTDIENVSRNIKNAKTLYDERYDELDSHKKIEKYKASGDVLRIGAMGDRPSGTRLIFMLLNATDDSDINELSLGGFISPMVGMPTEEVEDGSVVVNTHRHVEPKNTLLVCRNIEELRKLTVGQGGGVNENRRKSRTTRKKIYNRKTKRNMVYKTNI